MLSFHLPLSVRHTFSPSPSTEITFRKISSGNDVKMVNIFQKIAWANKLQSEGRLLSSKEILLLTAVKTIPDLLGLDTDPSITICPSVHAERVKAVVKESVDRGAKKASAEKESKSGRYADARESLRKTLARSLLKDGGDSGRSAGQSGTRRDSISAAGGPSSYRTHSAEEFYGARPKESTNHPKEKKS